MENPFSNVSRRSPSHARNLAHAFEVAHNPDDVAAALRMARRVTGLDSFGWLDGQYFRKWVDNAGASMGAMLGSNFETLRELACQYLGE